MFSVYNFGILWSRAAWIPVTNGFYAIFPNPFDLLLVL
jgi:hypothetical protein